jgi:Carboxypeptidase regulatory-like domain
MRLPCFILCAIAPLLPAQPPPPPPTPPSSGCAADGVVVNSMTGEPIPRAHVMALASQTSGTADNSGHWSLTNIGCGRLRLTATRPGFLNGGVGTPLTISSESPAHDVRIQLTPQSVVLGKVTDEQGDPVMNAQVSVLGSVVIDGHRSFQMTAAAQTNDLGEFRIASLPAGKFIFCARGQAAFAGSFNGVNPGNGSDSIANGETCYPGPVEGGAASAMELPAGHETRVDFSVRQVPAVRVRGTVSGMPKNQGAAVTLQQRGPARGPINPRPANIMPDGRFEVRGVTPGSYILSTDYWEAGGRLTARVPVEVGGSDVEGIAIHLEPGPSVGGSVRVESTTGKTLPDQQWQLYLRSSDPTVGGGQLKWSKDRTTFSIADITPGTYRLEGTPPPPFYLKSAMLGGRDLTREEVSIGQSVGQLEVVVADDSGTIEGVVQDSDGQPTRATVMVIQDGRPHTTPSGADGHFRIANLTPGDYRIYAWDDITQVEYADAEWMKRQGGKGQSVTISPGQTASLKLDLAQIAR